MSSDSDSALPHRNWLKNWLKVDDPFLEDFRKTWWGDGQRTNFGTGTWITIPKKVCETLQSSLVDMEGQMYLRDENSEMYGRLNERELHRFASGGVLLLGQSGTGISSLLLYFLIRRLSEAKPTLFVSKDNSTFFFASDGVWKPPSHPFWPQNYPSPRLSDTQMWSLVNSEDPPSPAIARCWWVVRTGYVATSTSNMLGSWCMRNDARNWYIPSWRKADLEQIISKHPKTRAFPGRSASLSDVLNYATPIPTEVLDFIIHPSHLEQRREELDQSDEDMFKRLSFNCRLKLHPKFPLVAIRDVLHTHLQSDLHILDFASPAVGIMVTNELKLLDLNQALSLTDRVVMPGVSLLDSWVFKSFIAHVLSDYRNKRFIERFFEMTWEPDGDCFVHEGEGEGQIEVGFPSSVSLLEQYQQTEPTKNPKSLKRLATFEYGVVQKRSKSEIDNSRPKLESLSAAPRHIQTFQTLEDIKLSSESFFVSLKPNPLFTFFFFEAEYSLITIWFLKTPEPEPATVDAECTPDSTVTVANVVNLVAKQNPDCTVDCRYVLVVPTQKRRIVWHMSLAEARGKVFVQEVDVDGSLVQFEPLPEMLIALYNPTSGDRSAKSFFENEVIPLLQRANKSIAQDKVFATERPVHAGEIVLELIESSQEELTIILGSGDGTLHEIINHVSSAQIKGARVDAPPTKLHFVLVPCGTANALYSSLFPPKDNAEISSTSYRLQSVQAFLNDSPGIPLTLAITTISSAPFVRAPPRAIVSSVVVSTSLHAAILHDSEKLRKEMPGIERFKAAAQQNSGKWYLGNAKILPAASTQVVQIYDPKTESFINHPDCDDDDDDGEYNSIVDVPGPFAYFLSTVNVDRLEPAFQITPVARKIVPSEATCDLMIVRPLRDPSVRMDSAETREGFTSKLWKVLQGAYQEGAHLKLRYNEEGDVVTDGDGPTVVEYVRCGGWEWLPDDIDDAAHLLCSDGTITTIEKGGRAVCVAATPMDKAGFYVHV
ncbi:hypothetical protein VKT23_014268 [Stygiomarasmius scandens]|uniref:DAGKc domain-containing protein n=1 Tax=Marasmiellus scandens TaxID=2682957 RepID=A0ABR1J0Z0_9AGAR